MSYTTRLLLGEFGRPDYQKIENNFENMEIEKIIEIYSKKEYIYLYKDNREKKLFNENIEAKYLGILKKKKYNYVSVGRNMSWRKRFLKGFNIKNQSSKIEGKIIDGIKEYIIDKSFTEKEKENFTHNILLILNKNK